MKSKTARLSSQSSLITQYYLIYNKQEEAFEFSKYLTYEKMNNPSYSKLKIKITFDFKGGSKPNLVVKNEFYLSLKTANRKKCHHAQSSRAMKVMKTYQMNTESNYKVHQINNYFIIAFIGKYSLY